MGMCCPTPNFKWEPDGDEQALVCSECGSVWGPKGESEEDVADLKEAWLLLKDRIQDKKTWGQVSLKELMLDCLLGSSRG